MTERAFSQLLKGNQVRYEKPNNYLKNALGISERTTVTYINEPSKMSVSTLMIMVRELHLRDEDLVSYLTER